VAPVIVLTIEYLIFEGFAGCEEYSDNNARAILLLLTLIELLVRENE
jgi:hypothetical protein